MYDIHCISICNNTLYLKSGKYLKRIWSNRHYNFCFCWNLDFNLNFITKDDFGKQLIRNVISLHMRHLKSSQNRVYNRTQYTNMTHTSHTLCFIQTLYILHFCQGTPKHHNTATHPPIWYVHWSTSDKFQWCVVGKKSVFLPLFCVWHALAGSSSPKHRRTATQPPCQPQWSTWDQIQWCVVGIKGGSLLDSHHVNLRPSVVWIKSGSLPFLWLFATPQIYGHLQATKEHTVTNV